MTAGALTPRAHRRRFLKLLRPGDGVILILFLAFAGSSFWAGHWVRARETVAGNFVALIRVGDRMVKSLALTETAELTLRGALGEITLRVEKNGIRVVRSTCPNQVCVKQGAVRHPGEMLVCVPNRLVVLIHGEEASLPGKVPVPSRGDAVTY